MHVWSSKNSHKKDVPLHPILSMTESAQHQLAKWLTSLQSVLQNLSSNCVSFSFTFVKEVKKFSFSPSFVFLCSFDISSLFTNVLFAETIKICADTLYNDDSNGPSFPCNVFVKLMPPPLWNSALTTTCMDKSTA